MQRHTALYMFRYPAGKRKESLNDLLYSCVLSVSAKKVPKCPLFSFSFLISSFLLTSVCHHAVTGYDFAHQKMAASTKCMTYFNRRQAASQTAQNNGTGSRSNHQYVDKYTCKKLNTWVAWTLGVDLVHTHTCTLCTDRNKA